ncbi:unnamed protein product, partial [marine sediment metagenome]
PLEGQTRFNDLIWGDVVFENNIIDDFVLLKSDGYPTSPSNLRTASCSDTEIVLASRGIRRARCCGEY